MRDLGKKNKIILVSIIIVISLIISIIIFKINKDKKIETVAMSLEENIENENLLPIDEEIVEENIIENNIIENEKDKLKNEEDEKNKKENNGTRYRLEVNCSQNVVNVYEKDKNGEYKNCVKAMLCSTGSETPKSGEFSLKKYGGWEWKGLFGDVYGQYATQITGNILFHSVPYLEKYNKGSLKTAEYDKLGTSASMGCIRLTVKDAKWIYDNCASGTKVMFYRDSNPGPLGKPYARKIASEAEKYNRWDPTDPSSNNPWRNYKKEEKVEEKEEQNKEEQNKEENNNNTIDKNEIQNTEIENNQVENKEEANSEIENNAVNNSEAENKTENNEIINNQLIGGEKNE